MKLWGPVWRFACAFVGTVGAVGTIIGTASGDDMMFVKGMVMVLFAGVFHPEMRS